LLLPLLKKILALSPLEKPNSLVVQNLTTMIIPMFTNVRTFRQVAITHTVSAMLAQTANQMMMTVVPTVRGSLLKNQGKLELLDQ